MAYNDTIVTMFAKIRALTDDVLQSTSEVFTYSTSGIFTIAEPRVSAVTETRINGAALVTGQTSTFNALTNTVTVVNSAFVSGDIVSVTYTYSKKSDLELFNYIQAALVWLSIYNEKVETYKLTSNGTIVPSPSGKELDLICVIAAILIQPDYISYKTASMSVTYPTKATKEDKIKDMVTCFHSGIGVIGIIEFDTIV